MNLRTRLGLLVSASSALLLTGYIIAEIKLEELHRNHLGAMATAGESALWLQMQEDQGKALATHFSALGDNPALVDALARDDPTAARDAVAPMATALLPELGLSDVQILGRTGEMLLAISASAEPHRILDAGTIDRVLDGANLHGMRQVSFDRFVIAAATALRLGERPVGILTLAVPAARLVHQFASASGGQSYLLSLRGRMMHGTDEALWRAAAVAVPVRRSSVGTVAIGDASYLVTGVPLNDMAAGAAGVLVTLREATVPLRAADALVWRAMIGALVVGVLTLCGLYVLLGRAFRPLDQAINVLQALAHGKTGLHLRAHGDDEIRRIAEVVIAYERDARAAAAARRNRELQRRRQERFIRIQMVKLADALSPLDRTLLMAELEQIVNHDSDSASALIPDDDKQLGFLAAVMHQLSTRVLQKHQQLQEALIRETKLARLEQELTIARHIQTTILPTEYVDKTNYGIFGRTVPAREVGGDFYDFFSIGDDHIGVVVADVSDKGVPAAFFMAIARTLMRETATSLDDPGACLDRLNATLSLNNPEQLFVTLFYGILALDTGVLRYANAGHPAPILVGVDGLISLPLTGDPPLGILDHYTYAARRINLAPGDRLLIYSDGIPEATDANGQFYGMNRWLDTLVASSGKPLDTVLETILAGTRAFTGTSEPADDMTLPCPGAAPPHVPASVTGGGILPEAVACYGRRSAKIEISKRVPSGYQWQVARRGASRAG